jgi:hypothetical protein
MANNTIRNWELAGIPVIFLTGSAMHFVFELTGYWPPIAWLVAVNESVWEHFKLAFWPAVIYAALEYVFVRKFASNFWLGKSLGIFFMPLFIGVTYYSYTAILERFCLWIDMTSFFVAIVIGQFISLRLLTASQAEAGLQRLGAIGLWTMIATFVVFSYAPPRTFLFKDYYKDEYGILQQYDMPVFSAKQSK